jgi:hypothetical protein
MRTLVLVVVVVAACGKGDGGNKQAAPGGSTPAKEAARAKASDDRFGVESAKIAYRYDGNEKGTVDAYFEDFGNVVALEMKLSTMGGAIEEKTVVWKNRKQWTVQAGKPPWTSGFRAKDSELRLISANDTKQFEMAGYVKGASTTIAGQMCDSWSHPTNNVSFCRWQGIDLEYKNMGAQTVTAESVELGVNVPKDLLARAGAPQ